jgi:hypothetical protein
MLCGDQYSYADLVGQTVQRVRSFAAAGLSRHRAEIECQVVQFHTGPFLDVDTDDDPHLIDALEALCRARVDRPLTFPLDDDIMDICCLPFME